MHARAKTFKQLVAEAKAKHAVLTFGRFQPPTIGHEKLVGVLADTAKRKGGTPFLFPSRTNAKKKNPLTPKAKVKFLKSVFPQVTVVDDAGSKTIFQALEYLVNKGFKTATIVVGGDRIGEFEKTVVPYTKQIGMDNIDFVGAGARDPDATGVRACPLLNYGRLPEVTSTPLDLVCQEHPRKIQRCFTMRFERS